MVFKNIVFNFRNHKNEQKPFPEKFAPKHVFRIVIIGQKIVFGPFFKPQVKRFALILLC